MDDLLGSAYLANEGNQIAPSRTASRSSGGTNLRLSMTSAMFWVAPLWILLSLQNLVLVELVGGSVAIKPLHLLAIIPMGILFARRALPTPPRFYLFAIVLMASSSLWFLKYPSNSLALNYVFALLVFLLGQQLAIRLEMQSVIQALRVASGSTILLVVGTAVVNASAFVHFYQAPNGHPSYGFVFAGGANLEASWVGLLSLLFFGKRRLHIMFGAIALILAVLLASRIGVLLAVASLVAAVLFGRPRSLRSLMSVVFVGTALLLAAGLISNTYLAERVLSIGADPGSTGRFALWKNGFAAFVQHPWGFGAGNAVSMTRELTGAYLPEDNIHNVVLQWLLDFGPLGAVLWLWIALVVISPNWGAKLIGDPKPIRLFLLAYLGASLLQFRGSEPLFWFALGLFSVYKSRAGAVARGNRRHSGV